MNTNRRLNTVRGITASSLMRNHNRSIIQNIVQDQIKIIDNKISTAHQAGFNHIEHELPINFSINNMDKSDAQTIIYSELIETYTKPELDGGKGFPETYIEGGGHKTLLHINWLNGMDAEERRKRQQIIHDHAMRPKNAQLKK